MRAVHVCVSWYVRKYPNAHTTRTQIQVITDDLNPRWPKLRIPLQQLTNGLHSDNCVLLFEVWHLDRPRLYYVYACMHVHQLCRCVCTRGHWRMYMHVIVSLRICYASVCQRLLLTFISRLLVRARAACTRDLSLIIIIYTACRCGIRTASRHTTALALPDVPSAIFKLALRYN